MPEVWVFRDGPFSIHVLASAAYAVVASIARLPGLDFAVLAGFATREDTGQALHDFEDIVREAR